MLAVAGCATVTQTGSVYRSQCWHVGVRPATDLSGVAITVQATTDWTRCPK